MNMSRGRYSIFALGVLLLCLLSACASAGGTASSPTPTPKPKTPTDLLQSASTAMNKLTAYHLESNGTSNTGITGLPATTNDTSASQPITSTATQKIVGDQVQSPAKATSLDLSTDTTVGTTTQTTAIKEIVKDGKLYIQNKAGKWYILDQQTGSQSINSLFSSSDTSDFSSLAALTSSATLTDNGVETVDGTKLRHITATINKQALIDYVKKTLGSSLQQLQQTPDQQQKFQDLLNNMKFDNSTVEYWIDDSTSYIHQSKTHLNLTLDLSGLVTPTAGSTQSNLVVTSQSDTTAKYSNFNKVVTITAPADATPASSILEALQ